MVLTALSSAIPEKVIAGVGSPLWGMNLGGVHQDGTGFANLFFLNGGFGASASSDGINVLSWPSNVSSTPVEIMEQLAPLKVHFRQFRKVTKANGAHRGGSGQEILIESLNPIPISISFLAERTKLESAAPGLNGGQSGEPGEVLINGLPVNPKQQHLIEKGAMVMLRTPGGGGYGAVEERSPDAIESDVRNGFML
jgi:N-methylhydantoinase B